MHRNRYPFHDANMGSPSIVRGDNHAAHQIPLYYRVFFLYVEPLFALIGAIYAGIYPTDYFALTGRPPSTPDSLPLATHVVLRQLANMYLLFTLNEALVLRVTSDIRIWRALLFNLLVADLGHLYSVWPLGHAVYWDVLHWNEMDWGNVPFVYLGMTSRIAFLVGLGLTKRSVKGKDS